MDNTEATIADVVTLHGEVYHYTHGMSYREFCDKNPNLETRKAWDETTSDAMDAYYDCKEYTEKKAMGQ